MGPAYVLGPEPPDPVTAAPVAPLDVDDARRPGRRRPPALLLLPVVPHDADDHGYPLVSRRDVAGTVLPGPVRAVRDAGVPSHRTNIRKLPEATLRADRPTAGRTLDNPCFSSVGPGWQGLSRALGGRAPHHARPGRRVLGCHRGQVVPGRRDGRRDRRPRHRQSPIDPRAEGVAFPGPAVPGPAPVAPARQHHEHAAIHEEARHDHDPHQCRHP